MKIIFLVSGNGGNLKFFFRALQYGLLRKADLSVVADRECGALEFARENGLSNQLIHYSKADNVQLNKALADLRPDIVVTNWYKILDHEIVQLYGRKLINLHYSLLPAFHGLIGTAPVKQALEKGCRYVGATCHLVDEGVDTGSILGQTIVAVKGAQFEVLMDEIFRKGCFLLLNTVQGVSGQCITTHIQTSNDITFSPVLEFDTTQFHTGFWEDVARS